MADDKKSKSPMSMVFGAPEDDGPPSAPGAADDDGFDGACDDILTAIAAKDKPGFCEALRAAIGIAAPAGAGPEEPEPEAA